MRIQIATLKRIAIPLDQLDVEVDPATRRMAEMAESLGYSDVLQFGYGIGEAVVVAAAQEPDRVRPFVEAALRFSDYQLLLSEVRQIVSCIPKAVGFADAPSSSCQTPSMVALPPRLTFVTLGTKNMAQRRSFYSGWGWAEGDGGSDEYAQYMLGSVRLALYPLELLGSEAAPGCPAPLTDWNGVTLAVNVADKAEVDAGYRAALDSGARSIGAPVNREWGGYSAYVADPEGQRWEIAWAPGLELS